jgi:hypothetical protein
MRRLALAPAIESQSCAPRQPAGNRNDAPVTPSGLCVHRVSLPTDPRTPCPESPSENRKFKIQDSRFRTPQPAIPNPQTPNP